VFFKKRFNNKFLIKKISVRGSKAENLYKLEPLDNWVLAIGTCYFNHFTVEILAVKREG
jgi:hypothetical protein